MSVNVDLKRIYNDQCKAVVDLILPIQQQEFNVPVTLADQPDLLDIEKNYHQTGGGFWGAFVDGQLAGTIALIHIGSHSGAIRKMFVRKEFRGKELSLAQRLLDHLVAHSRQTGITDIYLGTVDSMAAAHRFYERNQFRKIKKTDLPSYFPLMHVDTVFYHLHLKND